MEICSSILWKITRTEEPGPHSPMWSPTVRHDWVIKQLPATTNDPTRRPSQNGPSQNRSINCYPNRTYYSLGEGTAEGGGKRRGRWGGQSLHSLCHWACFFSGVTSNCLILLGHNENNQKDPFLVFLKCPGSCTKKADGHIDTPHPPFLHNHHLTSFLLCLLDHISHFCLGAVPTVSQTTQLSVLANSALNLVPEFKDRLHGATEHLSSSHWTEYQVLSQSDGGGETWCGGVCGLFLSCVWLFTIPWSETSWLFCPWDFPGKNTGVENTKEYISSLRGIFPAQGSNQHLQHCRQILHCWVTGCAPGAT